MNHQNLNPCHMRLKMPSITEIVEEFLGLEEIQFPIYLVSSTNGHVVGYLVDPCLGWPLCVSFLAFR